MEIPNFRRTKYDEPNRIEPYSKKFTVPESDPNCSGSNSMRSVRFVKFSLTKIRNFHSKYII